MIATEKKAKILENDIANLVKYAMSNGINENKIVELAEIAYDKFQTKNKSLFRNKLYIFLALFTVIIAIVFAFDSSFDFFYALVRICILQFFSIWDLTSLSEKCLIKNPLYDNGKGIDNSSVDCNICAGMHVIDRSVEVDAKMVKEVLFTDKVPFVVNDAATLWKASSLFDLDFLIELFTSNMFLYTSPPCYMHTNFDGDNTTKYNSVLSLLHTAKVNLRDRHTIWSAYWENCNAKANRVLRKFYRRPGFIGPSIEMAPFHWIMISSNHHQPFFVEIDPGSDVGWYAQLRGSSKIQLRHLVCESVCKSLYTVLMPGDIVIWPNAFWEFSYKTQQHTSSFSLATLFGGFVD